MWKNIRLSYRRERAKGLILKFRGWRNSHIPCVLGRISARLQIKQCLQPWIFKLRPAHGGYRVGEFWRTRYLTYAEKVLVKKGRRHRVNKGTLKKKYMGQPSYPNLQRVGHQNLWTHQILATAHNREYLFQVELIKQLGAYYSELIAGGYYGSLPRLQPTSLVFFRLPEKWKHSSYCSYRVGFWRRQPVGRTWVLAYRGWLIVCFLVFARGGYKSTWDFSRALLYLRASIWNTLYK